MYVVTTQRRANVRTPGTLGDLAIPIAIAAGYLAYRAYTRQANGNYVATSNGMPTPLRVAEIQAARKDESQARLLDTGQDSLYSQLRSQGVVDPWAYSRADVNYIDRADPTSDWTASPFIASFINRNPDVFTAGR